MKAKKSFWASITGGFTSAAPILLSCCKSGACVGVCASPVASLFGVSSATLANSPLISTLEPVLIAISAVSFTISYYSLYVLPKLNNCNTPGGCTCEPTAKEKRKVKINKAVFLIGLILSIGFLSYFEISKYQAATAVNAECSTTECAPGECSTDQEEVTTLCFADSTIAGASALSCCATETNNQIVNTMQLSCKLTSPELRKRKETVIAELKQLLIEKNELTDGYAFKFKGDDQTIDKLTEFVKSERQCCDFFIFDISMSGDKSNAWLKLTGPKDAKEFITTQLGL